MPRPGLVERYGFLPTYFPDLSQVANLSQLLTIIHNYLAIMGRTGATNRLTLQNLASFRKAICLLTH